MLKRTTSLVHVQMLRSVSLTVPEIFEFWLNETYAYARQS